MSPTVLILASSSPRRAELLRAAGIPFEAIPADLDERQHDGEAADTYVRRLAEEKAARVALANPGRVVVGADTTVVLDGEVLGKPYDAPDATSMLRRLSGRSHVVLTGVCVISPSGQSESAVSATTVEFRVLTAEDIERYVASGEPMDKAGGYAIQGGGGPFVTRIEGTYDTVVGLPVALVQAMCRAGRIQVS